MIKSFISGIMIAIISWSWCIVSVMLIAANARYSCFCCFVSATSKNRITCVGSVMSVNYKKIDVDSFLLSCQQQVKWHRCACFSSFMSATSKHKVCALVSDLTHYWVQHWLALDFLFQICHSKLFHAGDTYLRFKCNTRYSHFWMSHILPELLICDLHKFTSELNSYCLESSEIIALCVLRLINPGRIVSTNTAW